MKSNVAAPMTLSVTLAIALLLSGCGGAGSTSSGWRCLANPVVGSFAFNALT